MKSSQRGHAMVELAVCAGVMVACLAGTFQFGYTFYVYNQLVSAVGSGARYASARTYRAANQADVEKGKEAIRNMVVYGDPHPDASAVPVVPGLKTDEIEVKWKFADNKPGAPEFVDVRVQRHPVNAIFGSFTFAGRPTVEFPYLGPYAPSESER
jgi:Flp pilus assembly protein TadG